MEKKKTSEEFTVKSRVLNHSVRKQSPWGWASSQLTGPQKKGVHQAAPEILSHTDWAAGLYTTHIRRPLFTRHSGPNGRHFKCSGDCGMVIEKKEEEEEWIHGKIKRRH